MNKEQDITIPLNLYCIIENDLTADLFVILYCKYNNIEIPFLIKEVSLDEGNLSYLQEKGFIKITNDNEFELRQKAKDIFTVDNLENKWLEFFGNFPIKVPSRNGGTRPLRSVNVDSESNDKIRIKYRKLIKNKPLLHKQILNVLDAELKMRKRSNSMQFMHNIDTWLNQADYDKYLYLLDSSETESKISSYGNKIK